MFEKIFEGTIYLKSRKRDDWIREKRSYIYSLLFISVLSTLLSRNC